ncbi:putative bifunctional diguanylate cyclase/phosphodiesterase [Algirhabdus cladophorae]|uniref:putative bifunctional diguanylate cyclase/phosphodiesterase n=1 Tax=Algirhabdus cladophorae TaxID=3377108 RepID=UPI003B846F07
MTINDQEALRAALVELEQLNDVAEKSRANAEMLLSGLELLSNVESGSDALSVVLKVLSSSVDDATLCVLTQDEGGAVRCLASTNPTLLSVSGHAGKALKRAFSGRSIVLSDSVISAWWSDLDPVFGNYGSALLHPMAPLDRAAVLVCLQPEKGAFSKAHGQRLQFFVPLAIQGLRQSEQMAEVEAARQSAERYAKTDFLTGLANRLALEEQALEYASAAAGGASKLWTAVIDLNAFKPINDNFGHDAGDAVLVAIGKRLEGLKAHNFVAARLGGDEFGILLTNVQTRDDLVSAGRHIVSCFDDPVAYSGNEFRVGASIGLAPFGIGAAGLEDAMVAADRAMYSMKSRRVTGYAIYQAADDDKHAETYSSESLRAALENGQFEPHYQPKIDLRTQEIIGFEALARWIHPTAGILRPGDFLKPTENSGLSNLFTRVILQNVFQQIQDWRATGVPTLPIALNLSEVYLASEDGAIELIGMMEDYGIGPGDVVFEITEDVLIARSSDFIVKSIQRLKDWGGLISLDDFGTGYGCLRNLLEMPVDEIKIDRAFVSRIGQDRKSEVILDAILEMSLGLGVNVVAEGVETATQSDQRPVLLKPVSHSFFMHCKRNRATATTSAPYLTRQTAYSLPARIITSGQDFDPDIGKIQAVIWAVDLIGCAKGHAVDVER